jgi:hypothetical protein
MMLLVYPRPFSWSVRQSDPACRTGFIQRINHALGAEAACGGFFAHPFPSREWIAFGPNAQYEIGLEPPQGS